MEYRRFGNTIIARIDKNEEILEQLKEIALKEKIKPDECYRVFNMGVCESVGFPMCLKNMWLVSTLQVISCSFFLETSTQNKLSPLSDTYCTVRVY